MRVLPDTWDHLHGSMAGPMHELDWAQASVDAFGLTPHMVVLGPPERPRAIAQLALVHGRLETIGVRQLSEPTDFLSADDEAAAELGEAMARTRLPLLLRRTPADSKVLASLRSASKGALVMERPMSSCPVLSLDETWGDAESHLSSKRRQDFRRARRRADQIETEVLIPTPEETPPLVATALEIEKRSWKGRNGTAILQLPGRADFFHRYCMMKAADGSLRLSFLRVDGETAAMQIAVERDDAYWLLKIGYDETYARCSPGQLMIADTIGWAARRGLRSYEFLGKAEDWISIWTETVRPCVAMAIYPPRPASLTGVFRDATEVVSHGIRQRKLAK